jgi:hypothetical protein
MPTCFVVQGFGKKTDFESGRVLDLDASYEVIREAVVGSGYDCVRADEIKHSRSIDLVMYEQLLGADLVIADLSTSNVNAFYELGVRFALRPHRTIVVAESRLNFPFDINHIPIRTYEHLGSDIGVKEAKRFSMELQELIAELVDAESVDSPVYTFLPALKAPLFERIEGAGLGAEGENGESGASLADFKRQAREAMKSSDFRSAAAIWAEVRENGPKDDYVVQQLALATYKSEEPDELSALREARRILEFLWAHESLDPETLGLWSAIHKRLYEIDNSTSDLNEAIGAAEKGFVLAENYYNGINLAYLLDIRAGLADPQLAWEHARARSIRRRVVEICMERLEILDEGTEERYWVLATLEEAAVGLGDEEAATRWHIEAVDASTVDWQLKSTAKQIGKLRPLISNVTRDPTGDRVC